MIRAYIYLNSIVPLNAFYINKILDIKENLSELLSNNEIDWINSDYSKVNYNINTYKKFNILNHKLMYAELIYI
jgi:hypothetical protein